LRVPLAPLLKGDDVELIAGLSIADPYRRLEDGTDPAVLDWQRSQADRADAYVAKLPGLARLKDRIDRYTIGRPERLGAVPRFAGGRWFRTEYPAGATQAHVVVAREPMGKGQVIFDAAGHIGDNGRAPFLSWISPAPDGRLLAIGLCLDGSEANKIRILDVESHEFLDDTPPQELMDNWMGGAQWLPDSSGFFFVALDGPRGSFRLRVFRHDVGQPAHTEPEAVPLLSGPGEDYVGVFVTKDWAVASQNLMRPRPVATLDLHDGDAQWRPFVTDPDVNLAGHAVREEFVAVTDHDAPRGRLVAVPLDISRDTGPASWRELVPESEAVIRGATAVGDLLYLSEFVDTYARIRVVDLEGTEVARLPLPGRGAMAEHAFPLMALAPVGHPDEFLFAFSSLIQSWGIYRHHLRGNSVETLKEPEVRLDAVVEDLWATSPDGTRVPYHVIRPTALSTAQPQPTLIHGYGGFNVPLTPQWPKMNAAFVEAGGVLVHAHLRGGGELGPAWWLAGSMHNKQNTYDDLYAIAEDLIAAGRTTSEQLGVTGGSDGGLLTGVAVTQRPDLWRAAVPRVPLLDLIGACRDPYGRAAIAEQFADPDDPRDVVRMLKFSPYHLVEDGTAYPAVYVYAGDHDPRCPAWHASKFVARLQEANPNGRPILLRIWENVGHGWATARDTEVAINTACLGFLITELGLATSPRHARLG
jgi:prolyl oligopeptidase